MSSTVQERSGLLRQWRRCSQKVDAVVALVLLVLLLPFTTWLLVHQFAAAAAAFYHLTALVVLETVCHLFVVKVHLVPPSFMRYKQTTTKRSHL